MYHSSDDRTVDDYAPSAGGAGDLRLDRRVAVVAGGGGGGIGTAICMRLARAGACVAVLDRDDAAAKEVGDAIRRDGGDAREYIVDLTEPVRVSAVIERVRRELSSIDILVNVVGGMVGAKAEMRPVHQWDQEEWDRTWTLNIGYVFPTCRAALAAMLAAERGAVVNIASISGLFAAPRHAPYGAAKAAMMSLTRSLAVEYGRFGIRVNAVAVGSVETPAAGGFPRPAGLIPLGRRGVPVDVANAALFLVSDMSAYITGHTLVVDGGASLRFPLPLPDADLSEASLGPGVC